MENQVRKQSEEALAEIYRNTQLALQSIADILPQVESFEIESELKAQHEEYEQLSVKATMLAKDMGIELKEPNPFKKAMMWGSIKINSMSDNSPSHIAEMMVQGTVMGITALRATAGELSPDGNERILDLLDEMIKKEETYERRWKEYL